MYFNVSIKMQIFDTETVSDDSECCLADLLQRYDENFKDKNVVDQALQSIVGQFQFYFLVC